jgi:hypothetical protein
MAEQVHVARRRPFWPWALLALAILALFLLFMWYRGAPHDDEVVVPIEPLVQQDMPVSAPDTAQPAAQAPPAPAEVSVFVRFAEDTRADAAGLTHDYTAEGLRQLAAALDAISRTQANLPTTTDASRHIAAMRKWADAMQRDPQSLQHADHARAAFVSAAHAMEILGADRSDGIQAVQAVRESAERMDAQRPMLDQATQIEDFFDRSAQALRTLSQAPA